MKKERKNNIFISTPTYIKNQSILVNLHCDCRVKSSSLFSAVALHTI